MGITRKKDTLFLEEGMGITHCRLNGRSANYPLHYHNFAELVYTLKGRCVHTVDGKEYPTKRGDMLLINYGQSHLITGVGDVEYINVYMKPEYISKAIVDNQNAFSLLKLSEFEDFNKTVIDNDPFVTFQPPERDQIEQLIFLLKEDVEGNKAARDFAVRNELNLLLILFFRKLSISFDESFDGIDERLLSYLHQHSSEKLSLAELSSKCGYNKSYFSRLFKKHTGMTFTAYVKKIRLENAASLLEETNIKTEDIYAISGYSDRTDFFKDFKKAYNKTPLKYRADKKVKK